MSHASSPSILSVAVGSANPVKLAAVRRAVSQAWPHALVVGVDVESGVDVQPRCDEEAIVGATNRARRALESAEADLGIGIEGNTVDSPYGMFTTAWVVVLDSQGATGIGAAGRLLLPDAVAQAVRNGAELGPLMDKISGEEGVNRKQGAVGILTNNIVSRTEALTMAVSFALARFVRPDLYE